MRFCRIANLSSTVNVDHSSRATGTLVRPSGTETDDGLLGSGGGLLGVSAGVNGYARLGDGVAKSTAGVVNLGLKGDPLG